MDYRTTPSFTVEGKWFVYYYVTATDFAGNEGRPARVNTLSGTDGSPARYVLSVTNHPNPFDPQTTIRYTVPSRGPVSIVVYDARGMKVATIIDHALRAAGAYSEAWDGRADNGERVTSGVSFARIEHAAGTKTRKMILVK